MTSQNDRGYQVHRNKMWIIKIKIRLQIVQRTEDTLNTCEVRKIWSANPQKFSQRFSSILVYEENELPNPGGSLETFSISKLKI